MNLNDVDLRKIYRMWKSNLGVFKAFFRSTAFVSLQTYDDFTLTNYEHKVDEYILKTVLKEYSDDYFTIVDLDLNEILELSLELNNSNNIKPILNVNLLFNNFGLIGNAENVSRLINCSLSLKNIKSEKYMMMIPYDRYLEGIEGRSIHDKLNNQYEIGDEDLPESEFLKSLGYKGIKVITKDKVKDDLKGYIDYISKDLEVKLVRVDK